MSNDRLPNKQLKQERLLHGWTQTDVAGFIGTDSYTVSRWERGQAWPRSYFCRKLCDLFGKSALELGLIPIENPVPQTITLTERLPVPHWQIPNLRNPFFSGREAFLETLHARLGTDQESVSPRSYALYGLGGIGKTQLAVEYAYRYALEYQAIFWIDAENLERIMTSFLSIAERLKLPERQEIDQQRIVHAVHQWLITHNAWLLIWDNLEKAELLQHFLPPSYQGAILITTRNPALGVLSFPLELPLMSSEEGAAFLLRRAKILPFSALPEPNDQLALQQSALSVVSQEIVAFLGGLPLALDQAGAYIEETGCHLSDYVQRYEQQRILLLDRRGASGGHHPHSVVTTFRLLFRRIAHDYPVAADLLSLCAFLSADAIPEEFFVVDDSYRALTSDSSSVDPDPLVIDPYHFDSVISTLRNFSLIQRHIKTRTLSIHRLVQVVLRAEMSEQQYASYLQRVVQRLYALFPELVSYNWVQCERLLPHILTCATFFSDYTCDPAMFHLLRQAATYLRERNDSEQNVPN